jgi:hypothetical protein
MTQIAGTIDDYDVYPIIDGTVVTLYWYGNSWRLSSSNGYDVTNMRWLSNKTYFDAIVELAADYPAFSFDRLSKSSSYTIGFRHHSFQPLLSDPQKMWFIQSCNTSLLNMLSVVNADISKIPVQTMAGLNNLLSKSTPKPVLIISSKDDIGLPVQGALENPTLESLLDHNANSLVEFSKGLTGDFTVVPHYGYFFRPKSGKTGLGDYMFESTLLHLIRKTLYNFPKKRGLGETELSYENRIHYAILRAYLSHNLKYPFINLFPQYKDEYEKLDGIFRRVAERITQLLRSPNDKKIFDQKTEVVAQKMASSIIKQKLNVAGPEGMSIIIDLLNDRRHLEFYFSFLIAAK